MSIQRKALLVNFGSGIGSSFRVKDKKASKEVCDTKGTATGRAEVNKRLLPENALDTLKEAIEAARDFHNELALPWGQSGERILRTDNFFKYNEGMRQHRRKVEAAKQQFLETWDDYYNAAPAALGALFDPTDFPSKDKVERGIYFEIQFFPVPAGVDFRAELGLPEEELAELRNAVDAHIRATLYKPFLEPLANMVKRLKEPDGIFRNTLVTNLQKLVKLVPPGDAEVDAVARELEELVRHDADTLRDNKSIRAQTAAKAEDILSRMASYLPALSDASTDFPTNILALPTPTPPVPVPVATEPAPIEDDVPAGCLL